VAKELAELLADLSRESRKFEDVFAEIAEETDAKAAERRDRTRVAAKLVVSRLEEGASSAEATVAGHWRTLQERISAQVDEVKAGIAERHHARDVDRAEQDAEVAEDRTQLAVAFAAAVQTVGLAVLDAALARREAAAFKRG
jgi:hypothetical protein